MPFAFFFTLCLLVGYLRTDGKHFEILRASAVDCAPAFIAKTRRDEEFTWKVAADLYGEKRSQLLLIER